MPIGPDGEKRPTDVIANTVHVMRVATGEAAETYINPGGRKGEVARAQPLSAECRREISKEGAVARWGMVTARVMPNGRLDA